MFATSLKYPQHSNVPPSAATAQLAYLLDATSTYCPKGRLVALQSPGEGAFALWPLKFKGRTAHLNFKTTLTGFIRVEALGPGVHASPRSFNNEIGVPLTVGFVSKWYLVLGTVEGHQLAMMVVLMASSLLSVGYLMPVLFGLTSAGVFGLLMVVFGVLGAFNGGNMAARRANRRLHAPPKED